MQEFRKVKTELDYAQTMAEVAQSFEEIYVLKMNKIKKSVEQSRDFFSGALAVLGELKQGGVLKNNSAKLKTKNEVAVYISGNDKFSGDINLSVFNAFIKYATNSSCDLVVLGKIGDKLYRQRGVFRKYLYYDLENEYPDPQKISQIVASLSVYKKVSVFYGKFVNLLTQNQTVAVISDSADMFVRESKHNKLADINTTKYIFEPSFDKIWSFFETQVFGSLFKQAVYESCLAQIGGRICTMEASYSNIEKKVRLLQNAVMNSYKKQQSKKQINNLVRFMTV